MLVDGLTYIYGGVAYTLLAHSNINNVAFIKCNNSGEILDAVLSTFIERAELDTEQYINGLGLSLIPISAQKVADIDLSDDYDLIICPSKKLVFIGSGDEWMTLDRSNTFTDIFDNSDWSAPVIGGKLKFTFPQ